MALTRLPQLKGTRVGRAKVGVMSPLRGTAFAARGAAFVALVSQALRVQPSEGLDGLRSHGLDQAQLSLRRPGSVQKPRRCEYCPWVHHGFITDKCPHFEGKLGLQPPIRGQQAVIACYCCDRGFVNFLDTPTCALSAVSVVSATLVTDSEHPKLYLSSSWSPAVLRLMD